MPNLPGPFRPGTKLPILGVGDAVRGIHRKNLRLKRFYHNLELACRGRDLEPCPQVLNPSHTFDPTSLQELGPVPGLIIRPSKDGNHTRSLLNRLEECQWPIALLDEGSHRKEKTWMGASPIAYFQPAEEDAARQIVRLLWENGHTHIAYISNYHDHEFSHRRLQHLSRCGEAGPDAVQVIPYLMQNASLLKNDMPSWKRKVLEEINQDPQDMEFRARLMDILFESMQTEDQYMLCLPLFDRVRNENIATAWVCANESLGAAAWQYLRLRGVEVPGRISLISFDDSPLLEEKGIAAYDYAVPEMAGTMVDFLLENPVSGRAGAMVVTPPGRLHSRASIGPARD